MMAAAGVLFSLGFVFTNQAFLHGDVSFAETVKAGEPLSTVMLGLLLQAESASLPVYASLGVVCTGVAMSCYSTTNFSMPSFVFAALSNFCFSGRAVVLKKVQRTAAISTTVTQIILNFAQMCSSGLMVVVPLALVFETGEVLASFSSDGLTKLAVLLACNGLMFTTYNVLSMVVLARTQLFTHTLLNAIRRIWIIFTSVLYFGNSMSVVNVMGAGVAVAGGVLYSMLNKHYAKAQR
jgi:solute carrier family 35 protein E1